MENISVSFADIYSQLLRDKKKPEDKECLMMIKQLYDLIAQNDNIDDDQFKNEIDKVLGFDDTIE